MAAKVFRSTSTCPNSSDEGSGKLVSEDVRLDRSFNTDLSLATESTFNLPLAVAWSDVTPVAGVKAHANLGMELLTKYLGSQAAVAPCPYTN
jgi:hypothetical protein